MHRYLLLGLVAWGCSDQSTSADPDPADALVADARRPDTTFDRGPQADATAPDAALDPALDRGTGDAVADAYVDAERSSPDARSDGPALDSGGFPDGAVLSDAAVEPDATPFLPNPPESFVGSRLAAGRADVLVILDASASMCRKQRRFAEALAAAAERFAAPDLDIRFAFVDASPRAAGRFANAPAPSRCFEPVPAEDFPLDTEDCPAELPPVIGVPADAEQLSTLLRCAAQRGNAGSSAISALSATLWSVSCAGPNAEFFQGCCPEGAERFAADCQADVDFLRPDALLAVVYVADTFECSFRREHYRICRDGGRDADRDGVPDSFVLGPDCPDPIECLREECGGSGAACDDACPERDERCLGGRCVVDPEVCRARHCAEYNGFRCATQPDVVLPVPEVADRLRAIKRFPEQLVVQSLVGPLSFTEAGNVVSFHDAGEVPDECRRLRDRAPDEFCCPGGRCVSQPVLSCDEFGGAAGSPRLLELAREFGADCPYDQFGNDCPHACQEPAYGSAVESLVAALDAYGRRYCLPAAPQCWIDGPGGLRPCDEEEGRDPTLRRVTIREVPEDGCPAPGGERNPAFHQVGSDPGCPSGYAVTLNAPPSPCVSLEFEFSPDR